MATLYDMLNGVAEPAPLPNVNPQGVAQAGSNMATMGGQAAPVTNPQEQPPATPEEFNARKNGWMQALDALRANPAAQQAMMFAASRMLNGPRFGQSQGGVIGEAAFGGMSMYNQLKENASEQELKQRAAGRRDQFVGAQTEDLRSQTETRREVAPLKMRQLQLDLDKAEMEWKRTQDPRSAENLKRMSENLIAAYTNAELETNPELAKRVARAALLKQEVENTYKDRLGSAAAERADKVGSTGGTDGETLAEKRYREMQELEDKAAALWATERSQGIAKLVAENKKLTPAAAAMQWDTMNPFNIGLYRAKARAAGKVPEAASGGTPKEPPKPMSMKEVEAALSAKNGPAPEGPLSFKNPTAVPYDPVASLNKRQTARIVELKKILSERYDADLYAELQALQNAQLQSQMPMTFPGR